MDDGTGMSIAAQIGMDRWYDEVASYCQEWTDEDMTPWTPAQERMLAEAFWSEASSMTAAEAICGIE